MANADHLRKLQQGVDVWNGWRREEPLVRPNLGRANLCKIDLREADLGKADLRGANLCGADLFETDFRNASLRGANLSKVNLRGTSLYGTDLIGVNFSKTDLREQDLSGKDLSEANLSQANLGGMELFETNLREADLSGANLSEADLTETNLSWATLRGANLSKANLSAVNLVGKDFSEMNLSGADLSGAKLYNMNLSNTDLRAADLRGAGLSGADLSGANLSGADLREVNLIDAQLYGANLTGSRLWESQRSGWLIKCVACQRAFWDRAGKEPTEYENGEFERIFAEKPRIVLRYPGGMSSTDLLVLPLIVERLQAEHPGSVLQIRSVQNDAGGASVTITVEDLAGRGPEAFGQDLIRIQTKLDCVVDERDRLQQRLDSVISDGINKIAEVMAVTKQEIYVYHPNESISIGGPTMNRDTYNVHGQAGAVGPSAHAQDNTFQQIQSSTGLLKLAEELGRLRIAMKGEANGTREQDKAISAVADAEEAAMGGNGPATLGHLKAAGGWALGIAERIGVAIAIEALKKAM